MDTAALRRRRRAYARRARLGFEGYRVGSAAHLLQAVLRPLHAIRFGVIAAAAAVAVLAGFTVALGVSGAGAGALVGGGWGLAGLLRFGVEVRTARRHRPPGWPDGTGVREPRRPPPDAGELREFRTPPPALPDT